MSVVNDGTSCENNLNPLPNVGHTPLRLFSVAIIMQEQEEKAHQHGKETELWLPSQTPGEVLIPV